MRIFGMTLWPEKISDEQFVERIRKGLRFMGRWRYVIALMLVVSIILFVWVFLQSIHLLRDMTNMDQTNKHSGPAPSQQLVYAIYYVAIMMGGFIGFMLGHMLSHIATILFANRTNTLLVECWDALSDSEKARFRQRSS